MRPLDPSDLLRIFDRTARRSPLAAASALLAAADPEASRGGVDTLPVGRRNRRFLSLFKHLFGARLTLTSACPDCRERVDFEVAVDELLTDAPDDDGGGVRDHTVGDVTLRFRLPTGADVATIDTRDVANGRTQLICRCLVEACDGDRSLEPDALTPEQVEGLGEAIDRADPLAVVRLELSCPSCDRPWPAVLDVARCLAHALEGSAQRLLVEIDCLARGYGWPESEILSLGAPRRARYLEMLRS